MRLFRFFGSVGQEMKKVTWPTWKENRRDSWTVISTSLFFVAFFALFDWLIQLLLKLLITLH
ncbi:preprotein translocase subunit SecE [Lactiplantibacillus carotarum]|uniref:preprotein translocase subunit SecE n=1 Tax=Lactiplantibacillus carotarum TaxID=2993456 RepID=UPI00298F186E|nr:preprotein translocase subunit SecE [Lactiplantibacillus carotarum]